jgi:hypothetical protein
VRRCLEAIKPAEVIRLISTKLSEKRERRDDSK